MLTQLLDAVALRNVRNQSLARMWNSHKHHIVAVDSWVKPPAFAFDHEFTSYPNTSPEELLERLKDATIVITSSSRITREGLESAPHLQLVSCNGTGTDHVDKDAVRDKGISLCRVPAQNTDSVSEHAFALYYGLRRRMLEMHQLAMDGESWAKNVGTLVPKHYGMPGPRVNDEEKLVVIGYGALGVFNRLIDLNAANHCQERTLKD